MLRLVIEGQEVYNEKTEEFSSVDDSVVYLEHSLVSLSKWESKHQVPFLAAGEKTPEQIFDYLMMMLTDPEEDPNVLLNCEQHHLTTIQEYIDSPQSATTFGDMPDRRGRGEVITSELIYYWMLTFNIPFECQMWHLNRLFSLIRICNVKQSKPKKLSRHEIAMRNRELNAKRKEQLGTSG